MKIKNLKYIFVFAFGVLFFPVTYAQSVTLEECSNVTGNYSIYTTPHGNVKSESNTNDPTWFYNNESALMWRFEYHPIAIGNNYNVIKSARFDIIKTKDGGAGFSSADSVWHLQNALHLFGCNIDRDCKLGMETSEVFFTCNICGKFGLEEPQSVGSSIICEDGFEVVTQGDGKNYCCKEEEIEITIGEPTFEQQNWDSTLDVYVYFSVEGTGLTQSNLHCDTSNFSVDGGDIHGITPDEIEDGSDEAGCTLNILTDNNSVTVSALEGVVQIGDNQSSAGDQTFTKPENEPEPEASECDHPIEEGGDCQDVYGGYFSFDSETNCCVQGGCNRPVNDAGECDDEGYANDGNGCCSLSSLVCTETQYSQGGNCIDCTGDTIANPSHTKCICDSSKKCCGIQLNMAIPFIGDCIENDSDGAGGTGTTVVNSVTAFPILLQGMMKIIMSLILIVSFLLVIVSGFMMTAGAFKSTSFDKGKTMIKNVIISLILLGLSGLILKLINPSFFGG